MLVLKATLKNAMLTGTCPNGYTVLVGALVSEQLLCIEENSLLSVLCLNAPFI